MFRRGLVTAADNTARIALVEFQDMDSAAWWVPLAAGVPDLSVDDVVYVAFLGLEAVDAVIIDREGPRTESDLTLGETDSTAYRGDRGKAAYDHSRLTTGNPHGVTKTDVGLGNVNNTADADKPVSTAAASALAAKADLVGGKVPSTQLPSYVDDVIEGATLSAFPSTGEIGKIYVALDTNLTYRWSGTAYIEISASLALGETPQTAYRGDRGKVAYDAIHAAVTVSNTDTITLTLTGQQIAAAIKSGSITMAMLATAILSGNAATVVTGVKGVNGNFVVWDGNGNAVDVGKALSDFLSSAGGTLKGDVIIEVASGEKRFWQQVGTVDCYQFANSSSKAYGQYDHGNMRAIFYYYPDTNEFRLGSAGSKMGFFGAAGAAKGAAYTQTYSTAARTVPAATATNPPIGGTGTAAGGYDTAAHRDAMITSLTNAIADIAALRQVVNSIIDDLQSFNLVG